MQARPKFIQLICKYQSHERISTLEKEFEFFTAGIYSLPRQSLNKDLWMSLFELLFPTSEHLLPANFIHITSSNSINMMEICSYTAIRQLSQMFAAIIFFHVSEYLLAIGIHGRANVTLKSLLISKSYLLAMVVSVIEYVLEIIFFPGLKEYWWINYLGLALVLIGELIRKLAILTAGRSFTHLIKIRHEDHHRLVTHGIYRFVRHPGYCGFFIWSIGTQIMLVNPLCTAAFTVVVWKFFAQRIPYEEYYLRSFFGDEYIEYAEKIPSGVPFVK